MTSPVRAPSLLPHPPASPPSSSSSISLSTLSPTARARIAEKRRQAQERLSRKRRLDASPSTKAQSQRLLHYLTPTPPPPSSSSTSRDVIVLDDDFPPPPRPPPAQPLSLAEREERRYDPADDGAEGDVDAAEAKAPAAGFLLGREVGRAMVWPRVQLPAQPSSRQGGSEHYQLLKSSGIGESSFSRAFPPLPLSDSRARAPPPSPLAPFPSSSSNPFSSAPPSQPAVLTSTDPPWRSKHASSSSSSSGTSSARPLRVGSEVVSPYFEDVDVVEDMERRARAQQPPVPPHRQHELYSEEEKQIWGLFDQAKRRTPTATTTNGSHPSLASSEGKAKRSLPVGLFDSPVVRLEERQERREKKRKKEHPLLEERRMAKRMRVSNPTSLSSATHRPPIPPPLPPPHSQHHPPAAPLPPKSTKKTQLLVDPRVAAVESQRQERQAQAARDRLTQQRLKPSLDELHAAVLSWSPFQLEGAVKTALQTRFTKVPLTFRDDVEYQQVFYPLLLEECRSEMVGALEELEGTMEERGEEQARSASSLRHAYFDPAGLLEVVSIVSYHQVNAFHLVDVERVDFSSSSKMAPLFTNDDLVLLWYRPSSSDPFEVNEWKSATLYTLARLERVHDKGEERAKGEKRKRGIRYKLQVHAQPGADSEVNAQKLLSFLLKTGAQWGMVKVITLITVHRQYRALESCALLSLFPWLKDPSSIASRSSRQLTATTLASTLQAFPPALTSAFNFSQKEAMATALHATDGITLIQGPPGTGKTRTIVGLINLLLVQDGSAPHHPVAPSSSTSLRTSPVPPAVAVHRILMCAPSNAAIDEIVVRLLHPDALHDARGKPLRPRIVRVGAGKRQGDKEVAKAQHSGVDVDAVSLDSLVAARMREKGQADEAKEEEQGRFAQKKAEAEKKDAAFYDAALTAVKEQLDEVHLRIADLEEKKAAQDSRAILIDPDPTSPTSALQPQLSPADEDLRKQLDTSHRLRKSYLVERKRLHEKKDDFFTQQRRAQQAAIDNRDALRLAILNESNLVCTTLTGAGLELFTQSTAGFDCVIIDEAAQAIELQTLIPLKYECSRFVLVGDDRQLSATVISTLATRYDYQQSLFSRLRKCGVQVQVIQIQYRMHPDIRRFPSHHFYHNQLQDADEVLQSDAVQRHPALLHPLASIPLHSNRLDQRIAPYVFYDVHGVESRAGHASLHNISEARVAVELFKLILRAHSTPTPDFISRVGVITPYQQQVSTLRRLFRDLFASDPSLSPLQSALEVSTVDSFQGREKDFIIFSAVRAHQHEGGSGGRGGIGFVADANRLNVALTRARVGLYVLGSARTLGKEEVWRRLIEDARERQRVVEVGEDVQAVFREPLHHPRWAKHLDPTGWGMGQDADGADADGDHQQPVRTRKIRRSLSITSADAAQPSPPTATVDLQAPKGGPTSAAPPRPEGAPRREAEKKGASLSTAAAPVKKKTQLLPTTVSVGVPSSAGSTLPTPAPGPAKAASFSPKPPSPSALNANAISITSLKRIPRMPEERKERPPSSSEKAAASHPPPSSTYNSRPPPSTSLRGLDLNTLMKAAADPTAGLKSSVNVSASAPTSAPPPTAKPPLTTAQQPAPLTKPKRTISLAAASPPISSVSSSSSPSPPPAKPSRLQAPLRRPQSTVFSPMVSAPPDTDANRSSSASVSVAAICRSPSATSSTPPKKEGAKAQQVRRQRSREEIDITASAVQDSEDDVVITASHVVAPQPATELEDGELLSTPPPPAPFLETERGSVRSTLPAYACPDCRAFHHLMDERRVDDANDDRPGRYQPQTFETACNHRMRQSDAQRRTEAQALHPTYVSAVALTPSLCCACVCALWCAAAVSIPPSSPPNFWSLSTPPDPHAASDASQ